EHLHGVIEQSLGHQQPLHSITSPTILPLGCPGNRIPRFRPRPEKEQTKRLLERTSARSDPAVSAETLVSSALDLFRQHDSGSGYGRSSVMRPKKFTPFYPANHFRSTATGMGWKNVHGHSRAQEES